MLSDVNILQEVSSRATYTKGCNYFYGGRVVEFTYDEASNDFHALVRGEYDYAVDVAFDDANVLSGYYCECPASRSYDGACKHVVAVLKTIQKYWGKYYGNDEARLPQGVRNLMAFFAQEVDTREPASRQHLEVILRPTLRIASSYGTLPQLEFTIGTRERMYVLKDIKKLIDAQVSGREIHYGKNFIYKPYEMSFDAVSKSLMDMLCATYRDEMSFVEWGRAESLNSFNERYFALSNTNLWRFFKRMSNDDFALHLNSERIMTKVLERRPELILSVETTKNGIKAKLLPEGAVLLGIDKELRFIYFQGNIYKVDADFSRYLVPLMQCFRDLKHKELNIPTKHAGQFLDTVVPALETIAEVKLDGALPERFYRESLETNVYFDRHGDGVGCWIRFKYGEVEIDPTDPKSNGSPEVDGRLLIRDSAKEQQPIAVLNRFGFERIQNGWLLADEEATYEFFRAGLPDLTDICNMFYTDQLKRLGLRNPGRVSAGVKLNTEKGMLEMSFAYEGMEPAELIALLAAYKLKKRYHRLKDGSFVSLESPEFTSTANLVEQLGLTSADLINKAVELPKYRAMYLDSMTRETTGFSIERNSSFKRMVQDIKEPQDMDYPVPLGIKGRLRDYQKTGFRWLKTLAHYGLGGILADDMGLGKTLQVIAFILSEKGNDNKPSLVIAPTSLIYNWEEEVRKFAPELKVVVVSGQPNERQQRFSELGEVDIVVTSYGLVKRDVEMYSSTEFKYCFVDEAQHIKNSHTLSAKSVKRIKAQGYFALTGTPVENSLSELWSIFDFLMPGYLLSQSKFTSTFDTPIVKYGDKHALQELGRHIRPFILRRMKKDVLKELPEKIESKLICEMTKEQTKLYGAYMFRARQEFESEVNTHGFEQSRIKILALLMRLRQICCHPSMFLEDYSGGSGKLEALLEILTEGLSSGRRALVFSQFTTMLGLIGEELRKEKIDFFYLDGATPAEERMRMVNAFNAGEKAVFLLSLRAGGTGLNLTGADMVIHVDPWWNPAVEDQATDRAYRIGQKNSVQVYKLLSRNTIEERIYELQEAKRALIDSVITPGESLLTKMSEAEIRQLFVMQS